MRAIELFAGAGGAALGIEAAGFDHAALVEWDPDACSTLRAAGLGPVVEGDVRDLDAIESTVGETPASLLWASPPCQAWSHAGSRGGAEDDRNGYPWTLAALDRFRPRWFVAENVVGLTHHSEEGHPDPERCPRCYLERFVLHELGKRFRFVGWFVLNAADYGVPQHRRRLFVWGSDRPVVCPAPTHIDPALARQRGLFGPALPEWNGLDWWDGPVKSVAASEHKGHTNPDRSRGRHCPVNRLSDQWYLATGEYMLPLSVAAAAQGFPSDHPFIGSKVSRYRQIGNAVPPRLAEVVASAVAGSSK